jgi:FtsP/CotA-like multicopper oxidase with cupredoxin domain
MRMFGAPLGPHLRSLPDGEVGDRRWSPPRRARPIFLRTACAALALCRSRRGFRFYHTHVVPMNNLSLGTYTGQAGPVYIVPVNNPGAYDREVFLALKEFLPSFSQGGNMAMDFLVGAPIKELQEIGEKADEQFKRPKGYEVSYDVFGINGKMLGHGERIGVKQGQRVLFHVLNASAGEIRSLALPGHVFRIVALDGNPVPTKAEVPVLWLGTAERISAIVEMNHAGV